MSDCIPELLMSGEFGDGQPLCSSRSTEVLRNLFKTVLSVVVEADVATTMWRLLLARVTTKCAAYAPENRSKA